LIQRSRVKVLPTRARNKTITGIGAVSWTTWDDLLLLVRRAGHKHAGVGAPAPQFV
jgi:hypothetical protein